jgi:hypothetical protein
VSLFLISGIAASGKSAICEELVARGYLAFDGDEDGLCRYQHHESGELLATEAEPPFEGRTAEFYATWHWTLQPAKVAELAGRAGDEPAFICGVAWMSEECRGRFTRIFELEIDRETLIHRLATRDSNDYGKTEIERRQVLDAHANRSVGDGVFRIDATQPLAAVADQVVALAGAEPRDKLAA